MMTLESDGTALERALSMEMTPHRTVRRDERTDTDGDEGNNEKREQQSFWKTIRNSPRNVVAYYTRLSDEFGWRFVAMVAIVYGLNQGVGEEFFGTGSQYFLTDKPPLGLGLEADRVAAVDGFANVPWQIKSVYGMISDTFPVYGLHRTPYIIFAGFVGVVSWGSLWLWPFLTASLVGTLLFFGNFSIASPDVMIDASVAEHSQRRPRYASDLQTLCWSSFGIGKILSASTAGMLYSSSWCGSRGLFGLTVVTSLVMLLPALWGWLGDREESGKIGYQPQTTHNIHNAVQEDGSESADDSGVSQTSRNESITSMCGKLRKSFSDPLSGPIYQLSILVLTISMSLGLIANQSEDDGLIFFASVLCSIAIAGSVYYFEKGIDIRLAKASVYLFLSGVVQPSSSLIYLWVRENEENCKPERNRPCFSPEFLSGLNVVGYFVFVIGTALYNAYFSSWSYKKIWTSTQLLLILTSMSDLVLVERWNLAFGLSDKAFVLGTEVMGDLVIRLNTMPLFVLAAATCPPGVEATLFAMNMGLSNFGKTLGGYFGIGLIWMLGGVRSPEFPNLSLYIIIRSMCHVLPILMVPCLVPSGSPDSELGEKDSEVEEYDRSDDGNLDPIRADRDSNENDPLVRP